MSDIEPPIPSPWEKRLSSREKRFYFFNPQTGETSWIFPKAPTPAVGGNPPAKRLKTESIAPAPSTVGGSQQEQPHVNSVALVPSTVSSYPVISSAHNLTPGSNIWVDPALQVNEYMRKVYETGYIVDDDGTKIKVASTVNPAEGKQVYNVIKDNKFRNTLEIGLANGASTVYICQALKDINEGGTHIAVDPFQDVQVTLPLV
jgi:hypothetical protein